MTAIATHGHPSKAKRKRLSHIALPGGVAGMAKRWHAAQQKFKWWELTLFVLGVLASLSVLGALFFAVGNAPSRVYTDVPVPPVDSLEFSTALSNLVGAPLDRGGTVTPLNNGDESVPALLDAVN